jgi:monothiol glutaredoxin
MTMSRKVLDSSSLHPSIRDSVATHHSSTITEIECAIRAHAVVVVGMAVNPFPRKARALLKARNIDFHYLEYGSYVSEWRKRTAIKMWSGWPTFPMVFVKGALVGGFKDLAALVESGELATLLAG